MSAILNFGVSKFRAINSGEFVIDGITILSGENGCGKSTVSKLLYHSFNGLNNYELLIQKKLRQDLRDILTFFEVFQQEVYLFQKNRSIRSELRREVNELTKGFIEETSLYEVQDKWISIVDHMEYILYGTKLDDSLNLFGNNLPVDIRLERFSRILKNILGEESKNLDLRQAFEEIRTKIYGIFKEANGKLESRPAKLLIDDIMQELESDKEPRKIELKEFDALIFSTSKSSLSIPFFIKKAIYIDTPMMISVNSIHNSHWDRLNELLLTKINAQKNSISEIISNEILRGDVEVEDGLFFSDEFTFKSHDGEVFNLLDVATGVKSFSIIQLLLKNGHLTDKTLLIIDEPESNLHPQWIIEYARVLVLLNQKLGVRFFLASHSPDFISAIRYISEKEGVLSNLNYYIARRNKENKKLFDYEHLGTDIDPIYSSFNIALDRISQYGIQ